MATSLTLDSDLQRKAAAKAAEDGLSSLSSAIRLLLTGYVSGRINIAASAAADTVIVEKVEEIPLDAKGKRLAGKIFAATRKRG